MCRNNIKSFYNISVISIIVLISGCASAVKPISSDITLKDALLQVREGIQLLQERPANYKPAGLVVSEVQVNLNVTANAKDSSKLGIDLAPGAVIPMIPKASYEYGSEVGLSRSNQITFKFQNLFLAKKDSLVGISITPITTTTDKTVSKVKDKETITEKSQKITQPLTLEQLKSFLDDQIILTK